MSPELLNAVKERISLGQGDDQIREELRQSGYDEDTITATLAQAKEAPAEVPAAQSATLPGVFSLIDTSVKYVFSRVDLWLLVAAPALLAMLMESLQGEHDFSATLSIISLLSVLAGVYFGLTAVYVVGVSTQQKASLAEGFQWVKSNGLALIWVGILTGMATMGGFLLFVIPGVILSVYLVLSYYAFVREGHRGLDALMRSRELVYGNWLPVFGRLLGVGFFFIVVFLVVAFILGFVAEFTGDSGLVAATVGAALIQTLFNLAGMRIAVTIFDSLRETKPAYQPEQHTSVRKKYKGLAWLGLFFPVLMIMLAVVLASLNSAQEMSVQSMEEIRMMMEEGMENSEY